VTATWPERPVAHFRERCGWTQAECARRVRPRWSVRQQARIEAGHGDLDRHLRPLARLFSATLGEEVTACYDLLGVPDTRRAKLTLIHGTDGAPGRSAHENCGAAARAGSAAGRASLHSCPPIVGGGRPAGKRVRAKEVWSAHVRATDDGVGGRPRPPRAEIGGDRQEVGRAECARGGAAGTRVPGDGAQARRDEAFGGGQAEQSPAE
jgi:hypothetical protein